MIIVLVRRILNEFEMKGSAIDFMQTIKIYWWLVVESKVQTSVSWSFMKIYSVFKTQLELLFSSQATLYLHMYNSCVIFLLLFCFLHATLV